MDLEKKNKKNEKIWEKAGFVAMYFIFTTLLYFILSFLNKLPDSWNFFHVLFLTLGIVLIGNLLRRILK